MIPKLKDIITGKHRNNINQINKKAKIGLSTIKSAYKIDTLESYKIAIELLKKDLIQIAKMSKEIMK